MGMELEGFKDLVRAILCIKYQPHLIILTLYHSRPIVYLHGCTIDPTVKSICMGAIQGVCVHCNSVCMADSNGSSGGPH